MMVHRVIFDYNKEKLTTVVRITAGAQCVETDANSNGIFQQPLHVTVEQGTDVIIVDLLDSRKRILATLELDTMEDVLGPTSHHAEHTYAMKQKTKGLLNPRIKLTMSVQHESDVEKGLLEKDPAHSAVDDLVRLQLAKAREGISKTQSVTGQHLPGGTELQVLMQACAGELEIFEGLGENKRKYVSISGPPTSKRWSFAIWNNQDEHKAKKRPFKEIDLMRIQSVQADPARHHVFVINYYDQTRMRQSLTFRRVDRARDVWVEILLRLVHQVHEQRHKSHGKSKQAS